MTVSDALSHGNMFSLDMGLLKAANSTPVTWVDDEQAPYPSNYQTVMALAQNHIHFLDVPGVSAGSADIFVIHCMCCSLYGAILTHPWSFNRLVLPASVPGLSTSQRWCVPCYVRSGNVVLSRQRSMC